MKKFFLFSFVLIIILIIPNSICWGATPFLSAASAILIDGANARVLYEKNAHEKRAPASTTKIMTTYLALELGNLDDFVTVSSKAAKIGGSSMYLSPNERVKFEDLLYGIMLNSGNDASSAIAEHLAGSVSDFANLMTQKADKLGARNTQFKNPHGLDQDGHYTTAYDLALITKYAMGNHKFKQIVKTKVKIVSSEGGKSENFLKNKNKLLDQFLGANGVKTGFTNKAGKCLVASAERNGQHLIAVILNSKNIWEDSKVLLQYGFDNFKPYTIIKKEQVIKTIQIDNSVNKQLPILAKDDLTVYLKPEEISLITPPVIQLSSKIAAPIVKGQPLGYVKLIYQGKQLGKVGLIAAEDVKQSYPKSVSNIMFKLLINIVKYFS